MIVAGTLTNKMAPALRKGQSSLRMVLRCQGKEIQRQREAEGQEDSHERIDANITQSTTKCPNHDGSSPWAPVPTGKYGLGSARPLDDVSQRWILPLLILRCPWLRPNRPRRYLRSWMVSRRRFFNIPSLQALLTPLPVLQRRKHCSMACCNCSGGSGDNVRPFDGIENEVRRRRDELGWRGRTWR